MSNQLFFSFSKCDDLPVTERNHSKYNEGDQNVNSERGRSTSQPKWRTSLRWEEGLTTYRNVIQ